MRLRPLSARAALRRAAGAALLATRGLEPQEILAAGTRFDPGGRMRVPVRDEHGKFRATRVYTSAAHGARALDDDDTPGAGRAALVDGRRFNATSHVARPTPAWARTPWSERAVFLVDDEVAAEVIARRLGATAIARAAEALIEDAAGLAARLAGPRGVVIALRRSGSADGDARGTHARRFARAAAAVEAAGGQPFFPVLGALGSVEDVIAEEREVRIFPATAAAVRLDPWR